MDGPTGIGRIGRSLPFSTFVRSKFFKGLRVWQFLGLTLGIAVAATWFKLEGGLGLSLEDWLKPDLFVRARVEAGVEPTDRVPVTIIDIDDATFSAWGQPVYTPRQSLIRLIKAASNRGAVAIVVDIDLTAVTDRHEHDQVVALLKEYSKDASRAPLILLRRLWLQGGGTTSVSTPTYRTSDPDKPQTSDPGKPKTSDPDQSKTSDPDKPKTNDTDKLSRSELLKELDDVVASASNLIWASPLHVTDQDGVIRFWRPAEAQCNPDGSDAVRGFLSPSMIIAGLLRDPSKRSGALDKLKQDATAYASQHCRISAADGTNAKQPGQLVDLSRAEMPVRLSYSYRRNPDKSRLPGNAIDVVGQLVPAVLVLPAREMLLEGKDDTMISPKAYCEELGNAAGARPLAISCDTIRNRVVVIAASHVDSADRHATPVGMMFGGDILANVVLSSRQHGTDTRGWLSPTLIGIVIFGLMCLLALWRSKFFASVTMVVGLVIFTTQSGRLGISAAAGYEAISVAVSSWAVFLGVAKLVPWGRKQWRLARYRLFHRRSRPSTSGIMLLVATSLTSVLDGVTGAAQAQTSQEIVGVVERIEHWKSATPSRALLERSGAERPLMLGEYIRKNDRIRVPANDTVVTVARQSGPLVICRKDAPAEDCVANVTEGGTVLQSAGDMYRAIQRIVSYYGVASTVNLLTRSQSAPRILIGDGRPQRILAGDRAFWLEWTGGTPPFELTIRQAGQPDVLHTASAWTATLPSRMLPPGLLRIQVRDKDGQQSSMDVEVVTQIPALPDFAAAAPTQRFSSYLQAGWLAMQGDGSYILEACIRLTAIGDDFQPAAALRLGLALGERPR